MAGLFPRWEATISHCDDEETLAARDREAFIRVAVVHARTCSWAWRMAPRYRHVFALVLSTLFPGGFVIPDWGRVLWRYGMANAILPTRRRRLLLLLPDSDATDIDSDAESN